MTAINLMMFTVFGMTNINIFCIYLVKIEIV